MRQRYYDQFAATVAQQLDAVAWQHALAEGYRLTLEEAYEQLTGKVAA
ncbi:hypothetical protein HC891_19110 [Candidatus Gracilibacteria bacterium]|nr:hypothetical protein [Candidatus Gracilibacteria bacterium]